MATPNPLRCPIVKRSMPDVLPDDTAGGRHNAAGGVAVAASRANEFVVLAVRNETDLLAVAFFRHAQSQFGRDRTNFRLAIRADRQQHAIEAARDGCQTTRRTDLCRDPRLGTA